MVVDRALVLQALVAALPIIAESLALWRAPEWLARFAFVPLRSERRVPLPPRPRVPAGDPGYRDDALVPTARTVPALHIGRVELTDALLVSSRAGSSFGLRRFYRGRSAPGRRVLWLVRIDAQIEGDELVFRAKQSLSALTLPFFFFVAQRVVHPPPGTLAIMLVVCFAIWVSPLLFDRENRDAAIREAFDVLERELRKAFEPGDQPRDQPPSQP